MIQWLQALSSNDTWLGTSSHFLRSYIMSFQMQPRVIMVKDSEANLQL